VRELVKQACVKLRAARLPDEWAGVEALGRDLPEFRRAQSTRLEAGFYGRQGCLPLRSTPNAFSNASAQPAEGANASTG
jgi:hypothetical protein